MKYIIFLFSFLFTTSIFAFSNEGILNQLSEVNAEWEFQPERDTILALGNFSKCESFNDWIALHLSLVEKTLASRDVSKLSETQKNNRAKLLASLNQYWKQKVFPVNDYLPYKNPVFIDRKGTHCAVGYLMQASGSETLAQEIDMQQKFAYVKDIKVNGVSEWANRNGFTLEELAWIQPGYPTTVKSFDMKGGLDGTVYAIVQDPSSQTIYAAGKFSKSKLGVSCNNLAAWISGFAGFDWVSVNGGVNGTVYALLKKNNKLYVGGEFSLAGSVVAKNIAVYNIASGQWEAMGSIDSTVRALCFYNDTLFAGGNFSDYVSKWNGTSWQGITNGFLGGKEVRTLEVWDNKLIIGGDFDLATGAIRKNVASYDGVYMGIVGFGTKTPVNDFEFHQGRLFAACEVVSGTDTCALASFENGDWVTELSSFNNLGAQFQGYEISKISSNGSLLYAAGDFNCTSGMYSGSNLMTFKKEKVNGNTTFTTYCNPLSNTDGKVNDILISGSILYYGGSFVKNNYFDTLNHVAYIQITPSSISNTKSLYSKLLLYPNPVHDKLSIQSNAKEEMDYLEIIEMTGRKVYSKEVLSDFVSIDVANISNGFYSIRILSNGTWHTAKFLKQ